MECTGTMFNWQEREKMWRKKVHSTGKLPVVILLNVFHHSRSVSARHRDMEAEAREREEKTGWGRGKKAFLAIIKIELLNMQ